MHEETHREVQREAHRDHSALLALATRWGAVAAAVFVLVIFAALCKYTAAQADDFDFAVMYRRYGVLGSQRAWYYGWNGRYFFNITASIALGEMNLLRFYWLVPALGFVMNAVAMMYLVRALFPRIRRPALLGGSAIWLAFYLLNAPAKNDTFYWLIGVLTYPIANVALALFGVFLARMFTRKDERERRRSLALASLFVFVTVGCNETSMVLILLIIGVAILVALRFSRHNVVPCLILLAVAGVCSAVVVLAPGNAVRQSFMVHKGELRPTLENSWKQFWEVLEPWSTNVLLLALTAASFRPLQLLGMRIKRLHPALQKPMYQVGAVLLGLVGIFATIAPSWWSKGTGVIPRTLNITYLVFMWTWFIGWAFFAAYLSGKIVARGREIKRVLSMATYGLLTYAILTHPWVKPAREELQKTGPIFRADMRERYAKIAQARASGVKSLVVPPLRAYPPDVHVLEMSSCGVGWPNASYGEYFGLDELRLPGSPHACPPVPQKALEVVNPYSMHNFRTR